MSHALPNIPLKSDAIGPSDRWFSGRVLTGLTLAAVLTFAALQLPGANAQTAEEPAATTEAPADPEPAPSAGTAQPVGEQVPAATGEEAPVAAGEEDPESPAGQRTVAKLIPDQKAFIGSPDTIIDVADVFAETELAKDGPIDVTIELNEKQDVAAVTLQDDQLTIKWGKVGKEEVILRATNPETGDFVDTKFHLNVWKPDWWTLALTVIGGLGIFLLGMKSMSEGLQAVAGSGLRRIISAVTDNRLMATGVGVLVTGLIQSSSITTVMVVGFVNSGFMNLTQAIGVIMGANIGTTVTAWIFVLKIGKYGLPIAGAAAFAYLFAKRDRVRYVAMAIMGLGLVFLGLELMKDGFSVVKDLPAFEEWFNRFSADSYWGIIKCAAVGSAVTFVVQSSSATMGITISLAATGVLPFDSAAALVLGQNVGTTVTAWLASLGATTNARRAAYFHIVFNTVGVIVIVAIFPSYLFAMKLISGVDADGNVLDILRAIAVTHTFFNVGNTLLFLPFANVFARLLERYVPETAAKEKPHLTNLDVRILETSVIGIEQSRVEILRMSNGCNKMMEWLEQIVTSEHPADDTIEDLFHREEVLDVVQAEIVHFLSHILSGNVPNEIVDEARQQLRMADEYESISDYIASILKSHLKLEKAGHRFTPEIHGQLLELHRMVADYLKLISQGYESRQTEVITKAKSRGDAISHRVKELRGDLLGRMGQEDVSPSVSVAFTSQLNSYRRVRDHALNVAEALAGSK